MATKFTESTPEILDANVNGAPGASIEIKENTHVIMQITAASGTHATHIVDLQCSLDGTTWHNVPSGSVNGVGISLAVIVPAKNVRARVSTAEGGVSTVNVYIHAI